ncbi:glycosyltransferase family 4 protein [Puniceicoccus vermicola]|uniref:Glycosyltransferase n=1 Tax=Puniceicoccus vermicola TaxID=388746 RepID=A0A7X1B240_9BACT|nr:glycosyltransferase family 4 protein [Puniceicoccus vermicola]MBC2604226.1 glycosyltransferase [Puniceicoccus vermicola]
MSALEYPKGIAFLGNFVPRLCGISTFTRDLYESIHAEAPGADCYVAAVTDTPEGYDYPEAVRLQFQEKDLRSYRRIADVLNFKNADVLCVQHEFGIYGGPAGSYLIMLLKEVRMPIVTTLHTILENPTKEQSSVMKSLTSLSDRLVVMSRKGREILHSVYGVEESKIDVIPHGIPDVDFKPVDFYKDRLGISDRKVLLTFGLIGPGKGIEHVIEALPAVIKRHPEVVYVILGATHPKLIERDGERYRLGLIALADRNEVQKHVIFHNRYVSAEELQEFIGAADIYVTPYLDKSQITSGTLAYAFGSGKVVVSTPYWHAEELLADGQGALVPFHDSAAMAASICGLLDDPLHMQSMQEKAYAVGRGMIWPSVGRQYLDTFAHACADRRAAPRTAVAGWTLENRPRLLPSRQFKHVARMSDGTGIFQHAIFSVPNFHEGYCVDDNARAFILCVLMAEKEAASSEPNVDRLTSVYLAFLAASLDYDTGRFRNFMSFQREWLEHAGSEDSHGRSLWATGVGAARAANQHRQRLSARLFEAGLPVVESFTSPRAWAFAMIGVDEFLQYDSGNQEAVAMERDLTDRLKVLWRAHATESWPWFERSLTYENARICQAMILSAQRNDDAEALDIGLKSLAWLASVQTTREGCFRPIGSNGFYSEEGVRADFDQQPVEAQAMIAACQVAYRATQDTRWLTEAKRAFEWFLGRNDLGLPLYDFSSGGCGDGLHSDRVNENQGAESTLAFHLSLTDMNDAELEMTPAAT